MVPRWSALVGHPQTLNPLMEVFNLKLVPSRDVKIQPANGSSTSNPMGKAILAYIRSIAASSPNLPVGGLRSGKNVQSSGIRSSGRGGHFVLRGWVATPQNHFVLVWTRSGSHTGNLHTSSPSRRWGSCSLVVAKTSIKNALTTSNSRCQLAKV